MNSPNQKTTLKNHVDRSLNYVTSGRKVVALEHGTGRIVWIWEAPEENNAIVLRKADDRLIVGIDEIDCFLCLETGRLIGFIYKKSLYGADSYPPPDSFNAYRYG